MSCGNALGGGYRAQQPQSYGAAPVRAGYSTDGMRICHGCGAIAPTQRTSCAICEQPFTRLEERAPERADGGYWAQIRTELTCRQCGSKSPIDEPDVDGTVTCLSCGTVQAFDVDAWEDAFKHAHAVADLAGPSPEGRNPTPGTSIAGQNPFTPIGISNTTGTLELTGMSISGGVMRTRNLTIQASPGHPLCGICHTPVDAQVSGTTIQTRCPTCSDAAQYRMPDGVREQYGAVVCTICDEHRTDRPEARMNATSAGMVVALHCPSCGGAIDVNVGEHFATCKFCKTACRIPARTLLSLKKGTGKPRPWWVMFRGPSPKRQELEEMGANPYAVRSAPRSDDDGAGRGLEEAPIARSPRDKQIDLVVQVVVPLAMLAVVGAVFFLPILWNWVNGAGSDSVGPPMPFPYP